jgi:cytochrome b
MQNQVKELVWELPIRIFHWSLVSGVIASYLSAKSHMGNLHVLVGYALCILLAGRVILGFVGSQYSRFDSFVFSISETLDYLRSMLQGNPKHYLGHNPAGALMVFALLITLSALFMSGLITLALIDFDGPFLFLVNYLDDETSYWFRSLHGAITNIVLSLIPLHLMGVALGSIQHKENLVRAMVTGCKPDPLHASTGNDCKLRKMND